MNNATQLDSMIEEWKKPVYGYTNSEIVAKIAVACLGWAYVFGASGQFCTIANRNSYANRSTCPADESKVIKANCQRISKGMSSCNGCKWHPNGVTRFFDCRGFTRWCFVQVGITIEGGGATQQWNTDSNWSEKGTIDHLPKNKVCCLFQYNSKTNKMAHTGIHIGSSVVVHCSGEVLQQYMSEGKWTHYAIPKGLNGDAPTPPAPPTPTPTKPTLRKGAQGAYVKEAQQKLINWGFSVGAKGADGIFGQATYNAVIAFQRANSLSADGIIGKNTWAKLDETPSTDKYTATIKHLTTAQMNALKEQYPSATFKKE